MVTPADTPRAAGGLESGRGETSDMAPALLRESTARRFKALSHPARLRLIELLARGSKSVSELARMTGLPADTVSKHLRALAAVHVVRRSQQGNFASYAMRDPELQRLVAFAYRGVMREAQRLQRVAALAGKSPAESGRGDGEDVHAQGTSEAA